MSRPETDLTAGLAWWRDCTCDPSCCAHGDCLLCVLLDPYYGLPCPRDREYGLARPGGVAAGARLGRPLVVTLCGSMRFLPLMLRVAAQQTAAGAVVLAPFAVVAPAEQDSQFKARLDALHRRKLDLADRVVVVSDESGYYGASTRREIAYAEALGTPIRFHRCPPLTPVPDDPVGPAVCEVVDAELAGELQPVDLAPAPALDVLEAEVVAPAPYRCPLDADPVTGEYPTVLRRAGVTGPGALPAIGARGGDGRRAWWRTLATRRPAGSRVGWW